MATLEELVLKYAHRKELADEAQLRADDAKKELIDAMKIRGLTTTNVADGRSTYTTTLVEASRVVIDEPKLQAKLGAKLWDKIQKKSLDKQKLEAAISLGDIDLLTVAECSEEIPNAPFIRLTAKHAAARKTRPQSEAAKKVLPPKRRAQT